MRALALPTPANFVSKPNVTHPHLSEGGVLAANNPNPVPNVGVELYIVCDGGDWKEM